MNIVGQVISAVESGGKVAWTIFFSSLAVLAVEQYDSTMFAGLPDWTLPSIRIVFILSLVMSIASITNQVSGLAQRSFSWITGPARKRLIRQKLLQINIFEVLILSKAIAESDRTLWAKPDLGPIISLQDKGLISSYWCGVISGDGTSSFEIPKDVWRVLLSMDEFRLADHARLLNVLANIETATQANIRLLLPQQHPAVRPAK